MSNARITCAFVALLISCGPADPPSDDDVTGSPTPTMPPASPTPTPTPAPPLAPGTPLRPTVEIVADGSASFAETLADHRVVFQEGADLFLRSPIDGTGQNLGSVAGDVYSATELQPDGTLVVTGSNGVFVLSDGGLVRSPLTDALEDEGEVRALATPGANGSDLWLATSEALHLYRGGRLYRMNTAPLPSHSARLAWGAPVGGTPVLWVASGDALYALVEDSAGFSLWDYGLETPVEALAADADGLLWAVADGLLYRRTAADVWDSLELETPILGAAAHPAANGAWFWTASSLYRIADDRYSAVEGASLGALRIADPFGRLLLASGDVLERMVLERPTYFLGLGDGQTLAAPTDVYLLPTLPDDVTKLELQLDGAPVTLTGDWQTELDPLAFEEGLHTLRATAFYEDLPAGVSSEMRFIVGVYTPPSWEEEIEPIYESSCRQCHGPDSATYKLDSAAAWETKYDKILQYVTSGYMPLPPNKPLTEDQIFSIRAWGEGGFAE